MPVCAVIEIEIKDPAVYSRYVEQVPRIVRKYGGRYLVRGGRVKPLSGDWVPERMVVIEFETVERLRACLRSAEYLELAPLREQSTTSRAIVVEGVTG